MCFYMPQCDVADLLPYLYPHMCDYCSCVYYRVHWVQLVTRERGELPEQEDLEESKWEGMELGSVRLT